MWTFLLVVLLAIVFGQKLSSLRRQNEQLARRLADLHLEIGAVRQAFLARIAKLEQGGIAALAPEEQQAPAAEETGEPVAAEPTEPSASETPAKASPPEPPPARFTPPPAPPDAEQPVYAPPAAARSGIEWERLIGVRGAALLGAIVLGLAALLFLQYSIEHGLIPPIVRVAIGFLVGASAIVGSEFLRRRGYISTANALAGGGVIVLYAATWAAKNLYGFIDTALAFALMSLTTAVCGLLSWRHAAREIALLGLAGGFATPLLLSSGQNNPIGLFGYLLLLNIGLFALAREKKWPLLTLIGLCATTFYQAGWIVTQMETPQSLLGLGILALFAIFFAAAGKSGARQDGDSLQDPSWQLTQAAGLLLPFALAVYFASRAELSEHLLPVAGLMFILSACALWIDRADGFPMLPLGSAAASVAIFMVWTSRLDFDTALSWESVAIAAALAILFHVFEEPWLRVDREGKRFPVTPALTAAAGFLATLALMTFPASPPDYLPWLLGVVLMTVLLLRQAWTRGAAVPLFAAAGLLGAALGFSILGFNAFGAPEYALRYAVVLLGAASFQALAFRGRIPRPSANAAAAGIALLLLVLSLPMFEERMLSTLLYFAATTGLAALAALAATRLEDGKSYLTAAALAAFAHTLRLASGVAADEAPSLVALLLFAAAAFTVWPLAVGGAFLRDRWTTYAAALAGPLWFIALAQTWDSSFGDGMIGIVPLALGALSLGAAMRLRQLIGEEDAARLRGLVWFAAVALSFVSIAIPLQLEKEWITIGWALQAFALLQLWKRLDHPGLKYFALMLSAFVIARLILNPQVFEYYARSGRPVLNWMMYGYLVPAAALVGAAAILNKLEIARLRDAEKGVYINETAWGAVFCFSGAIAVVFAWINLTIFDAFSAGRAIEFTMERLPARDLTLSAAWAVFALGLLAVAFRTNTQALRWTSLAFLLLTIGKVFLYDLGELEDLYRVASLVGLALSLLAVSIAYQRFVFGRPTAEDQS
jgi:uncharacterized membrane protein